MLLVLAGYGLIVWLLFFKLELLPWNKGTKSLVAFLGLSIILVVVGLLNALTPSGRVTVMAPVIEVAPIVSGTVVEVAANPNSVVQQGDVLLRLDKRPFEYALLLAEANFDIAQKTYDRKKTAFEVNQATVSKQAVDEAASALAAAEAQLFQARYNLDHTDVLAPSEGEVTGVRVSVGDQVSAFTGVMPMIRSDAIIIGGVFSQNGWSSSDPGSEVGLAFERYPGRLFWATVYERVSGTGGGQVAIGATLLDQADIGSTSEMLLRIAWPEELDADDLQVGAVGTATIIDESAGPIGILAKVLLWVRAYAQYL